MVGFTDVQKKRLLALGADAGECAADYSTSQERDRVYRAREKELVSEAKDRLQAFRQGPRRPGLLLLQNAVEQALVENGFAQVTTPLLISRAQLKKMSIDDEHPLNQQVFWLDRSKCLRPMLAPNLYSVSIDLMRVWEPPVRVFEIGSCFRKESQGAKHLAEFTMCNLVEWGTPEEERMDRLRQLAALVMEAAGIGDYGFEETQSEVYGDSLDVVKDGTELASGSMGPHPLDGAWGIRSSWVGIGFGLERLLMTRDGANNIHSVGKSLSYLDGVPLNIQ